MHASELPTVGYLDKWFQALYAQGQAPAAPAATAANVLYSKTQLAGVLGVDVNTVGRWLSKGKTGRSGQVVKLRAYKFTSEPRIPWAAVLAYHRGEDFDLDALPPPLLVPELAPAPPLSLTPPGQEPPAMRVVA